METLMRQEISQQVESLPNAFKTNEKVFEAIKKECDKHEITSVVLAARGSSDNACQYFKYLCEIKLGLPCSFAAPSVLTLYNGKLNLKNTLVLGVSQSGKAADVMSIIARAKENGAVTVNITNNLDSPMAKACDFHIFLNTGEEKSVAATKTFTTQMFVLGMLVATLAGDNELKKCLLNVNESISKVIANEGEIKALASYFTRAVDCYVLARGMNYCACQETALKIQETTYIKARAYAISDFHHGPFAVIDHTASVIVFAQDGVTKKDNLEMIAKLKDAGAFVIVIGNDKEAVAEGSKGLIVPTVCEFVAPFIYTVTAQLFAHSLALSRGINPDAPRGLKKVTITK